MDWFCRGLHFVYSQRGPPNGQHIVQHEIAKDHYYGSQLFGPVLPSTLRLPLSGDPLVARASRGAAVAHTGASVGHDFPQRDRSMATIVWAW